MSDILVVDDEKDIRGLICDILEDEGYGTRRAASASECLSLIEDQLPDLLILDIWLKDSDLDGIDILMRVKREYSHVPVVIISGHGNIEIAVEAIRQGAYDFIEKPFNIDQLLVVIRRAMEASALRRENVSLRMGGAKLEMIGESQAMRSFMAHLEKVFHGRGRIVLQGPTGVGKDFTARYIHQNSSRAGGPFVIADCASIAEEEIDRVLFGSAQDVNVGQAGLIENAHGGTLYFDHLDKLPLSIQPKIVRFMVDGMIHRAATGQRHEVDVRIISSTTQNLEELVAQGLMQSDFFHRINVVPMHVPSLNERREDIGLLVHYFSAELANSQGLRSREFTQDALGAMEIMRWPGNLRQLRNFVERVMILAENDKVISRDDFPSDHGSEGAQKQQVVAEHLVGLPLREAREEFEREYLMAQIERFAGNISKTAGFVGMERSALHRKLKSLGVMAGHK